METVKEEINYDVVIIGGGPSGLASAIKLKQLSIQLNKNISIALLEKGSRIGSNIVSGCVMNPDGLDELIPDWQNLDFNIDNKVHKDSLYFLTTNNHIKIPHPKKISNIGYHIISLSQLCNKLGEYAEKIGIDIFSGFSVSDVIIENDNIVGVITNDSGIDKNGIRTNNYQPGIIIKAKQTIIAEGCRGSIAKKIINYFQLDKNKCPQTYGLGIKEIWQINHKNYNPGTVEHFIGYPLNNNAYGGGFIYHMRNNLIAIGLVCSLDYKNPYLSPYEEFQKFKLHPKIKDLLTDGIRLEYAARTVTEGGIQSLPRLDFNGGCLVGDSAGFLNVAKIKGVNNAIKSGILVANHIFELLTNANSHISLEQKIQQSSLYKDIYETRNIRPSFKLGLYFGIIYSAIDIYILNKISFWTFKWKKTDHQSLKQKNYYFPIHYDKADNVISFDKTSSLHLSNINHNDNQPIHLKLINPNDMIKINYLIYDSPETKYCPAGVYEILKHKNNIKLQINSQNCIHCKACDIKDPTQNINWTTPESGSGPQYQSS
jgi:electron-transferring-flavoprotein dehydrogenase